MYFWYKYYTITVHGYLFHTEDGGLRLMRNVFPYVSDYQCHDVESVNVSICCREHFRCYSLQFIHVV